MTGPDRIPDESPDLSVVVRQRLADNLGLVVAALVVLALVGGWVAYAAHVNPPTEPTERTVGTVETGGEYEHAAVVRSENPVYPVDATLHDRRYYFHSVAPVLNGTFTHAYAADGDDVVAESSLSLRIRSADDDGEYWSVTEPLADRRVRGGDTDRVAVPFEVNVTETRSRIAETDSQFGGSPGDPEIVIVAETSVSATVDGERVTTTTTHRLPIASAGSTYAVGPAETDTASERVSRTVDVPREYGPGASYGAVVLFLGAAVSIGLVVGSHRRGTLAPPESLREAATTARERNALDEWITTGRVPPAYRDGRSVSVTSLSGLVDVAIDCDRRVIEDDRGGFYVVDGDVVYAFEPGGRPADRRSSTTLHGSSDHEAVDRADEDSDRAGEAFEWTDVTE